MNRELCRVALGICVNLKKNVKRYKFTPPSLIKATPSESVSDSNIVSNQHIVSNQDIARPAMLSEPAIHRDSATKSNPAMFSNSATFSDPSTHSNADGVMVTSSSQREEIHNKHSTPTTSNPLEGSTTAVVAVMRGNPKDGYTCHRSNKHCKETIVRVLLDSGLMLTSSL